MKNYRPVSNLSWISKVIEKAAGNQLSKHSQANETGEIMQSAYKAYHSTETAMMWIFNVLLTELDKGNAVLMALRDLSGCVRYCGPHDTQTDVTNDSRNRR